MRNLGRIALAVCLSTVCAAANLPGANASTNATVEDFRPDAAYGVNGKATAHLGAVAWSGQFQDVIPQSDGSVIVMSAGIVRRIRTDGGIDPAYGVNGEATLGEGRQILSISPLGNGKIAVLGNLGVYPDHYLSDRDYVITVLLPTGAPDPAFANGGVVNLGKHEYRSMYFRATSADSIYVRRHTQASITLRTVHLPRIGR
jgi:hypothetical protein